MIVEIAHWTNAKMEIPRRNDSIQLTKYRERETMLRVQLLPAPPVHLELRGHFARCVLAKTWDDPAPTPMRRLKLVATTILSMFARSAST